MILLIGTRADPVLARVARLFENAHEPFVLFDESESKVASVTCADLPDGRCAWHIVGDGCRGDRSVRAVFIRRGPAPASVRRPSVAARVDAMLLDTACDVVNRPSRATGNYSKPFQLLELAAAGFRVPTTLVTGVDIAAMQFIVAQRGDVVFKGISSVKTVPQVLQKEHLARLPGVAACPGQFQENVAGEDWRVTVVGSMAFASEMREAELLSISNAEEHLPRNFVDRCVEFTRGQGLAVGGIDLRLSPEGEPVVFELNPFPLLTHYEEESDPLITREVCRYLSSRPSAGSDIFV